MASETARRGVIDPQRIYSEAEVTLEIGWTYSQLKRARKEGLQCRELSRGHRCYMGQWLLDWLEGKVNRGN